jgi:hypothetical protein
MENDMNRLALIAATGVLALVLTACNDNSTTPKQPTANNPQQQGGPAPAQQPNQGQQ